MAGEYVKSTIENLSLGLALRGRLGGCRHVEADGDDDAALLTEERVDVRGVVAGGAGREELVCKPRDCRCRHLQALVRGGVEGAVVDPAGVRNLAGQERALCAGGTAVGRREAGRGSAYQRHAGGQDDRRQCRSRPKPAAPSATSRSGQSHLSRCIAFPFFCPLVAHVDAPSPGCASCLLAARAGDRPSGGAAGSVAISPASGTRRRMTSD